MGHETSAREIASAIPGVSVVAKLAGYHNEVFLVEADSCTRVLRVTKGHA